MLRPLALNTFRARNFPNLESFGFFLTDRAFFTVEDNRLVQIRASPSDRLVNCGDARTEIPSVKRDYATATRNCVESLRFAILLCKLGRTS